MNVHQIPITPTKGTTKEKKIKKEKRARMIGKKRRKKKVWVENTTDHTDKPKSTN